VKKGELKQEEEKIDDWFEWVILWFF
jgi:hypothetical protein